MEGFSKILPDMHVLDAALESKITEDQSISTGVDLWKIIRSQSLELKLEKIIILLDERYHA